MPMIYPIYAQKFTKIAKILPRRYAKAMFKIWPRYAQTLTKTLLFYTNTMYVKHKFYPTKACQ